MEGWELIAVAAVILLLFGANRLPKIARQLGEAKTEMDRVRLDVMGQGPDDDDDAALPPVVSVADPVDASDPADPAAPGGVIVAPAASVPAASVPAASAAAPAAFAAPDVSRPVSEPARSRTLPPPLPPPG